jgi:hypothetical protein
MAELERLLAIAAVIWALRRNILTQEIRRLTPAEVWPYLERAVNGDVAALEVLKGWIEAQGDRVRLQ